MSKINILKYNILVLCLLLSSCSSRPRDEIYNELFGKTSNEFEILNAQDHTSFIDCCIWLHLKVDGVETLRISNYDKIEINPNPLFLDLDKAGIGEVPKWWKPKNMDGVFSVEKEINRNRVQIFYISGNKTEVYIKDILF
jgi:hypothetical protein